MRMKARGFRDCPTHNPKVSVTWDETVFRAINKIAAKEGKSFSSVVNSLARIALKKGN